MQRYHMIKQNLSEARHSFCQTLRTLSSLWVRGSCSLGQVPLRWENRTNFIPQAFYLLRSLPDAREDVIGAVDHSALPSANGMTERDLLAQLLRPLLELVETLLEDFGLRLQLLSFLAFPGMVDPVEDSLQLFPLPDVLQVDLVPAGLAAVGQPMTATAGKHRFFLRAVKGSAPRPTF